MTRRPGTARQALAASFVVYVVFGLPDGVFGTVWPNLRDHFGRSDSGLGLLILSTAAGYAVGSVSSGHLSERFGSRVLPVAMAAAAVALATIAAAPAWTVAMIGYLVLGTGWGVADAAINAWMALTQGPREMGLLHGFYGIGAVLGPLMATSFVAGSSAWRAPYFVCAILTAGTVAILMSSRRAFSSAPLSTEVAAASGQTAGSNNVLVLMVTWFAVYVGLEVAVGTWSFTFLTEGRGESEVFAGIMTACFWGGLMAGRFGLAAVGHRLRPEQALRGSTVVALLAAATLWADPGGLGWLSLPVLGLALSMMFPVVMGRTAVYLGEARASRAVGYQIGASAVGFTILPAAIGVLAERHGIVWAAPVILGAVIVTGGLWLAIEQATGRSGRIEISELGRT